MRTFKVARSITALAHAPGSLWVGDAFGRVHRWDVAAGTGGEAFRVSSIARAAVNSLSVSSDGRLVLAASFGPCVLWDTAASRPLQAPRKLPKPWHAALSADGNLVLVSGSEGAVVWDRAAGAIRVIAPGGRRACALSASSSHAAFEAGGDFRLVVHDVRDGAQLASFEEPFIEAVLFTPDGSRLLSASGNHITVRDTTSWATTARFRTGQAIVRRMALHPGGNLIAAAGDVPVVTLWGLDGRPRGKFDWGVGKVQALSFSPDGMTAVAGGTKGLIAVWDVEDVG